MPKLMKIKEFRIDSDPPARERIETKETLGTNRSVNEHAVRLGVQSKCLPRSKCEGRFQSSTIYKHQNLISITNCLSIDGNLGLASAAPPMSYFRQCMGVDCLNRRWLRAFGSERAIPEVDMH